jgi:hypothetical protein
MNGKWINIYNSDLPLRSWWIDSANECEYVCIHNFNRSIWDK